MKYQLTDGNVIIATQDFIDENYPDAALIEEPPDEESPAVAAQTTTITMRQARLYLHQSGLTEQVESLVSELDEVAQIEWQHASTVEINSPVVQLMCTELGLTSEQAQKMFDEAAKL